MFVWLVGLVWFSLTSDYLFVIWGLRVGDVNRVSYLPSPGVCLYVCILQDLSGKRWISLYLFWLTDKHYIVIIIFSFSGDGMKIKALKW